MAVKRVVELNSDHAYTIRVVEFFFKMSSNGVLHQGLSCVQRYVGCYVWRRAGV